MPIRTIRNDFPRLGTISCGWQDSKEKNGGDVVTFPRRSNTLCFHSDDLGRLEVLKDHVGGEIRRSPTSTDEFERWTLVSTSSQIAVHIPPTDDLEKVAPQYMQLFASSGLVRECDGITTLRHRLAPDRCDGCTSGKKCTRRTKCPVVGDLSTEHRPCICDADGLTGDQRCKPVIRLSVILADLWADMPGLGVWQVRSGGWGSNNALGGELDLYKSMLPSVGGAARFRLAIRMARSRHGEVPQLHLDLEDTPRQAAALAAGQPLIEGPVIERRSLDEPVGTFVDVPEEEDGIVDADPTGEDPLAPEFINIGGVPVPFRGGTPASKDVPGITQPQLQQLQRLARRVGDDFDPLAAFEAYAGHDIQLTSRATAQAFSDFLLGVVREKEAVAS